MTLLIAFALLSALCTIYLIAPIAHTHQWRCYALMLIIPVFSVGIYMNIGGYFSFKNGELSPSLPSQALGFKNKEQDDLKNEEINLRKMLDDDKANITLISQLSGVYMKREKHDAAIKLLSDALQNPDISDNKDLQLQLATAYFAKGLLYAEHRKTDKALEYLQIAYDKSPKDAPFLPDIMIFMDRVRAMNNDVE